MATNTELPTPIPATAVVGDQSAVANITSTNLPDPAAVVLLTDVTTYLPTLVTAAEARLDALESKVNAMLAALRTAGLLVP